LDSKYGGWRALERDDVSKEASIWWRDLSKTCGGLNESKWFKNLVSWKIGRRDKVKVWLDKWIGEDDLVNSYPRFFFEDVNMAST